MFGTICLFLAAVCEFWAAFIDPVAHLGGNDGLVLQLVPLGLMFFLIALLVGAVMPMWHGRTHKE